LFDYTGRHAYHLVTVTRGRPTVLMGGNALAVIEAMKRAAGATDFDLLVYTVMPDHVHMLVLGADDGATATRFVQRFKQVSGFALREHGRPFWQQSFFDHVVRPGEDILPIARYILENPWRAGLVQSDDEWLYQGGTLLDGGSLDGAKASSRRSDGAEASSLRPAAATCPPHAVAGAPHKDHHHA